MLTLIAVYIQIDREIFQGSDNIIYTVMKGGPLQFVLQISHLQLLLGMQILLLLYAHMAALPTLLQTPTTCCCCLTSLPSLPVSSDWADTPSCPDWQSMGS